MFGGFAPPQLSEEEIKQMEAEANFSIQQVVVSAVLLYLLVANERLLAQPLLSLMPPPRSCKGLTFHQRQVDELAKVQHYDKEKNTEEMLFTSNQVAAPMKRC
ncbi:hypothetical protein CFIO01_01521 [Colletotrichum fioriniae PJ7]|uniref:Uncharacterized protein n=1 Tax=Colletotrichum fioriniae PJ7 TaxID=1445577 RepID=A0A010RZT5_9PEZI|nr:hypothetical protein CFIO01_01521 [Colletotrichum fioriniae PJ7]